jgi:hypothetical protein
LDNRPGERSEGSRIGSKGGSRIIAIDPSRAAFRTLFHSNDKVRFYTPYRGKHQILENGNILIAETDAGRVFEVTSRGELVWSFVNGWDDDEVAWLMSATRYPESYLSIASTKCSGQAGR